jgi:hypothetical protein
MLRCVHDVTALSSIGDTGAHVTGFLSICRDTSGLLWTGCFSSDNSSNHIMVLGVLIKTCSSVHLKRIAKNVHVTSRSSHLHWLTTTIIWWYIRLRPVGISIHMKDLCFISGYIRLEGPIY